jgi:fructose-1,6-bisphosphatase I
VKLHQRAPFFVGTKSMVEDAERFIAENPDE